MQHPWAHRTLRAYEPQWALGSRVSVKQEAYAHPDYPAGPQMGDPAMRQHTICRTIKNLLGAFGAPQGPIFYLLGRSNNIYIYIYILIYMIYIFVFF